MERMDETALTVDLRVANGTWRIVVERDGRRSELDGLDELIRYLRRLPGAEEPTLTRGLR